MDRLSRGEHFAIKKENKANTMPGEQQ